MKFYCFLFFISFVFCDEWTGDDENAPGINIEYRVHIDAKKEDCYWQYVHPGATLYVSVQVVKGGDGKIGMAVKDPKNGIIRPYSWEQESEYEGTSETGGYYSVCIDNQFSKFAAKLVNLYISTFRYDLWEKYTKDMDDLDVSVSNFTESLKNVDHRIHEMRQYQSHSRSQESRDYQLMIGNTSYVFYWSLAQCVTIILASIAQVFMVKGFFQDKSSGKYGVKA